MLRYIVKDESDSGHCCFEATVMDTQPPWHWNCAGPGDEDFEPMPVCECMDRETAEKIAAALNAADKVDPE